MLDQLELPYAGDRAQDIDHGQRMHDAAVSGDDEIGLPSDHGVQHVQAAPARVGLA